RIWHGSMEMNRANPDALVEGRQFARASGSFFDGRGAGFVGARLDVMHPMWTCERTATGKKRQQECRRPEFLGQHRRLVEHGKSFCPANDDQPREPPAAWDAPTSRLGP